MSLLLNDEPLEQETKNTSRKKWFHFLQKSKKTNFIFVLSFIAILLIFVFFTKKEISSTKKEKEIKGFIEATKKLEGVDYRTEEEIKERLSKNKPTSSEVTFKTESLLKAPYTVGRLSNTTLNNAMLIFNNFRYIAGIPATVTLKEDYIELAQAASLLMCANKKMAHSGQPQPEGMDKSIYDLGVKGCSSSNIYAGISDLNAAVFGWVEDYGNFNTMGHRRWILNPSMEQTGFGFLNGYSAMYCFDNSFTETKYYGVAWPAQNTPLSYFGNKYAWTFLFGKKINTNDIIVTLKNVKDGKEYIFDKNDPKTFLLENSNYGKPGCIAFLPSLNYQDGDTFEVGIHGKEVNVDYTVHFFKD